MTRGGVAVTPEEALAGETVEESLRTNTQGTLGDLAESTGGFLIANSNDMKAGMERVAGDIVGYYEDHNHDDRYYTQPIADSRFFEGSTLRLVPADGTPDGKGEFRIPSLIAGRYRIETRLPTEDWFVRSITAPGPAASKQQNDVMSVGLPLSSGQRATDLTVTLAEGAAGLRGKVVAASESTSLPARLRIHIVPARTTTPFSLPSLPLSTPSRAISNASGRGRRTLAPWMRLDDARSWARPSWMRGAA